MHSLLNFLAFDAMSLWEYVVRREKILAWVYPERSSLKVAHSAKVVRSAWVWASNNSEQHSGGGVGWGGGLWLVSRRLGGESTTRRTSCCWLIFPRLR